MDTRRISELASLSDAELFQQLSDGVDAVVENAVLLWEDADALFQAQKRRGYRVLMAVAEEEAAKAMILIDAARCPRDPPDRLTKHLSRFYDHLAKGLYVLACDWAPERFGDLVRSMEAERATHYLDGPSGVDWVFPNQILRDREETLYVDFVTGDRGARWTTPRLGDALLMRHSFPASPGPLALALAMRDTRFSSAEGLAIISELWRTFELNEETLWRSVRSLNIRTLEELRARHVLRDSDEHGASVRQIANEWTFPLHSVDLKRIEVKRSELEKVQRRWDPQW